LDHFPLPPEAWLATRLMFDIGPPVSILTPLTYVISILRNTSKMSDLCRTRLDGRVSGRIGEYGAQSVWGTTNNLSPYLVMSRSPVRVRSLAPSKIVVSTTETAILCLGECHSPFGYYRPRLQLRTIKRREVMMKMQVGATTMHYALWAAYSCVVAINGLNGRYGCSREEWCPAKGSGGERPEK
jgi:hypothetical protein